MADRQEHFPSRRDLSALFCSTFAPGFDGGAVLGYHNYMKFIDCRFEDNQGYGGGDGGAHDTGGGGAICMVGSLLEIEDSYFADNIATDPPSRPLGSTGTHHGGAVMSIQGHIRARNSTFVRVRFAC